MVTRIINRLIVNVIQDINILMKIPIVIQTVIIIIQKEKMILLIMMLTNVFVKMVMKIFLL